MAKKENPNLVFRREWWDQLRHKKPELFKESLTLLFSVYFDGKEFDPYIFDEQGTEPTPAEEVIIPMVKTAIADRDAYVAKCERNAANAKKKSESHTTACERIRPLANADDRIRTQGNIIEGNVKEGNVKEDNSFFYSADEDSSEKEKKQLLLSASLFYLSQGYTKPMEEAIAAFDYNETEGWTEHKANGRDIDHSKNKLKWMKGWKCSKGVRISPVSGTILSHLVSALSIENQSVIDHLTGFRTEGEENQIIFDSKEAVKTFYEHCQKEGMLNRLYASLHNDGVPINNKTRPVCEK